MGRKTVTADVVMCDMALLFCRGKKTDNEKNKAKAAVLGFIGGMWGCQTTGFYSMIQSYRDAGASVVVCCYHSVLQSVR